MIQISTYSRTSFFFKFCETALATIAIVQVLMIWMEFVPPSFWEEYGRYFQHILVVEVAVAVFSSVAYTWVWHRRERRETMQSGLHHAWLQGIIRYWLALSISMYGFAKILKTQFQTPDYRLDMLLGEVSGFGLTWYYFGYSYALAVIIALFQIGGAMLLLYRQTTLLGVMILLPVMVNIVLINLFFNIATGAFFNSIVFTLALLFLLLLDWTKLKRAFWDVVERLPPVVIGRHWTKHILRLLPIIAAVGMIQYLVHTFNNDKILTGTWKVERLTRNGKVFTPTAWLTDSTVWNRVYFAGDRHEVAFSPNPYRYKPAESLRGNYEFNNTKNTVRLMLYPSDKAKAPDTLQAILSERTHKAMRLWGVWWGDTVTMQLARLR